MYVLHAQQIVTVSLLCDVVLLNVCLVLSLLRRHACYLLPKSIPVNFYACGCMHPGDAHKLSEETPKNLHKSMHSTPNMPVRKYVC
jgi:hypothetical protein